MSCQKQIGEMVDLDLQELIKINQEITIASKTNKNCFIVSNLTYQEMIDELNLNKIVELNDILEVVSKVTEIKVTDIVSKSRVRETVDARQMAIYLMRHHNPNMSLKSIANKVGLTNHTTVLHSIEAVNNRQFSDKHFDKVLHLLKDKKTISEVSRKIKAHY